MINALTAGLISRIPYGIAAGGGYVRMAIVCQRRKRPTPQSQHLCKRLTKHHNETRMATACGTYGAFAVPRLTLPLLPSSSHRSRHGHPAEAARLDLLRVERAHVVVIELVPRVLKKAYQQ